MSTYRKFRSFNFNFSHILFTSRTLLNSSFTQQAHVAYGESNTDITEVEDKIKSSKQYFLELFTPVES